MKICVDARCLNRPHLRGIGRMVKEVVERSPSSVEWILLADRRDLPFHAPRHNCAKPVIIPERGYRIHTWEQGILPAAAAWYGGDLLFCPANTAPIFSPIRKVSVVHDVIQWKPEFSSEATGSSVYQNKIVPKALLGSDLIVTVSHTSANEIRQLWPSAQAKVIYNGVSEEFFKIEKQSSGEDSLAKLGIHDPFVVYIGGEIPRKRFAWALEVWKPIAEKVQLVTCGISEYFLQERLADLPEHVRRNVRQLGFLRDDQLHRLISSAKCVLYPTLYEGFGLPVIESNAVGTPIIYSPCGSLAEFSGPVSKVVDTYSRDAWTNTLLACVSSEISCRQRAEGTKWARGFSWNMTALEYYKTLQSAMK